MTMPFMLQGRVRHGRGPKVKTPCPDCGHDIRRQHHTTNRTAKGFRLGYCVKCKDYCPSIIEMYKYEEK